MVAAASLVSGFGGRWDATAASAQPPWPAASAREHGGPQAALGKRGGGGGGGAAPVQPQRSELWVVEDARQMGLGIGLIVASQLLQALQLWADQEKQWREERTQRLSPLAVVGCEGVIGVALMVREFLWEGRGARLGAPQRAPGRRPPTQESLRRASLGP
jgi:hypothetical protein